MKNGSRIEWDIKNVDIDLGVCFYRGNNWSWEYGWVLRGKVEREGRM